MFNAKQMLDQLMQTAQGMATNTASPSKKSGISDILSNPMVAGGGGLLAGLLLGNKKVRKMGGTVAAVGGAAALGAIAFKAYRNWQASKGTSTDAPAQDYRQQPQQTDLDFDNLPTAVQEENSRAMLTAIIAAAKADGHFDERERQMIHEQTQKIGDTETTAWVQQEIYKPLDINQIAALATSPELAAEIYLASLMVIDEQNEREKTYLNSLAERMGLEPQLRREIEQRLDNYRN